MAQQPARIVAPQEVLETVAAFERVQGEALWRQIANFLEGLISTGAWPAGSRMPTETELAQALSVNRHTLRRSLQSLSDKGLITSTPRRGTFVKKRRVEVRLLDDDCCLGPDQLIAVAVGPASLEISEPLGLADGALILNITTKFHVDRVPCFRQRWLSAERFGQLRESLRQSGDFSEAMRRNGVSLVERKHICVFSDTVSNEHAEIIGERAGADTVCVTKHFVDCEHEPIFVSLQVFPADRVELLLTTEHE